MDTTSAKSHWSSVIDLATLKAPHRSWLQSRSKTVCPLDRLGLLHIAGPEAAAFLDRLVTCKPQPTKQQSQLCALCNPKGRILSCFTVFYMDDDIYLQMPHELIDITMQRLKMYVLTAKVELNDASADLLGIGYIGSMPSGLSKGEIPRQAPGSLPRHFVYATPDRIASLWQQATNAGYIPASYDAWHYSDIGCGIPNIYRSTIEKLTPQMINLDLIGAVSFSKGCYPGQEIIARTHYLGKVKRRCYIYSAKTDDIKAGDAVYRCDCDEACGMVVDNHALASDHSSGLVTVQINALNESALYVKTRNDPIVLQVEKDLPPSAAPIG